MKKLFNKKILVLISFNLYLLPALTQSPDKMSYQAVIRNTSNNLVTNQAVCMQISIIQGSATGTAVYVETQTPTTNVNGLVSIEIGGGSVVSGNFAAINWANGPYFIKTETDPDGPTGGIAYTITGTSQLLSVPYALYAKNAGNSFSGNYNDLTNKPTLFDGNYASLSNKPNIQDTVKMYGFSGNYNDLTNKPTVDGSETKLTAGTNITITGSGSQASPYLINASSSGSSSHYVGELYGGGVVFWIDHTGQHGLIVSMVDLSTSQFWSNITSTAIGTTNDWEGVSNTTEIIGQSGHTSSAAKLCDDYTNADYGTGTYSDWYLPSIAELNLIWNNFYEVQKALINDGNDTTTPLLRNYYWPPKEGDAYNAWSFMFLYNGGTINGSKTNTFYVRAVRSF